MTSPAESHRQHQQRAAASADDKPIGCAVLTISDSRTAADDRSGDVIVDLLTADERLRLVQRDLVADEAEVIEKTICVWADDANIDAIITTGGTGVSRRDVTIEVVERLLTIRLDGFGELFRMASYEEIGAAAMLSRAVGGLIEGDSDTFLFALPGSPNAVRTAMEEFIVPQLPHLVWQRRAKP